MPPTSLTLLLDEQSEHIYVSVRIAGCDFDLCRFPTAAEAGAYARKWVTSRGLRFAPNSARVLDRAQRLNSAVITFEVITNEQFDIINDAAAHAWVDVSEGILPWPFMP